MLEPRMAPRSRRASFAGALAAFALCASACGNGNGGSGGSGGSGGTGGSGTTTTNEPAACATDARAQVYTVGLTGKSADGSIQIAFMDAEPAPPAKGNNTWTVKITDAAGKGLEGATIETKAYMPDHGHTSPIKPMATSMGSGVYEVTPVNLFMPGIWEITLTVTPSGGKPQPVVFTFCIAG